MSHSYSPAAACSQMDENKQDLPKKHVEPFGSSCQFESAGNEAFSLSERRKGESQGEGRNGCGGDLVGGGAGAGALCKHSPVTRAGSFMLSSSSFWLSSGAICSVCSLWAPPGC